VIDLAILLWKSTYGAQMIDLFFEAIVEEHLRSSNDDRFDDSIVEAHLRSSNGD
jgi:hypothetical protein